MKQKRTSSPGTYIDPPVKLSRGGSLIVFNVLDELICLILPPIFVRISDGLKLGLGNLYTFPQTFDLIEG